MKIIKKSLILILVLALIIPLTACGEDELVTKQVFAMDTSMILKAYGKNAEEALNVAIGEINSLNISLDPKTSRVLYMISTKKATGVLLPNQRLRDF